MVSQEVARPEGRRYSAEGRGTGRSRDGERMMGEAGRGRQAHTVGVCEGLRNSVPRTERPDD